MLTGVASILAGLLAIYATLVAVLYGAQRSLMYHRTPDRPRPAAPLTARTQVLDLPGHDGIGLFSWWIPPADDDAPVILYFHGNAGHQGDREERAAAMAAEGWGLLMAGYRYNSGSDGTPSEAGLIADGKAVLDWLLSQGIAAKRVVLFGESLGSGIAVAIAAARPELGGIILDSPYDSIVSVAADIYWYAPVRWLIRDRFESDKRIGMVGLPLLIGHGTEDRVVPLNHGRLLFAAANEPKQFALKPNAGHVELFEHGFLDDMRSFFREQGLLTSQHQSAG